MLKVKNTPSNDFELEPWEVDLYDMHNDMVFIFVEKHDGLIFTYGNVSRTYISHGKTLFDAFEKMEERFPNSVPVVMNPPEDQEWIWEDF